MCGIHAVYHSFLDDVEKALDFKNEDVITLSSRRSRQPCLLIKPLSVRFGQSEKSASISAADELRDS